MNRFINDFNAIFMGVDQMGIEQEVKEQREVVEQAKRDFEDGLILESDLKEEIAVLEGIESINNDDSGVMSS